MRAYVAELREIIWTLPQVVVGELREMIWTLPQVVVGELREGLDCQCICSSCGPGVCLCWLAFRRQLAMASADAGPIDALAGIEMVRPRSASPAMNAGLRQGDVLPAVDGTAIESIPMLQDAIRSHASGDEIPFDVQRQSGERSEVPVVRS